MKKSPIKNHFARPRDYLNQSDVVDVGEAMLNDKLDAEYFQIHEAQTAKDCYGAYIPPLKYPYYYIGIVKKGEAIMSIDLVEFSMKPFIVFFFHPKQLVTLNITSKKIDGYFMTFSELFALAQFSNKEYLINSLLYNKTTPPCFVLKKEPGEEIYELFKELYAEFNKSQHLSNELTRLKLLEILFKCERSFNLDLTRRPGTALPAVSSNLVQKYKELIELNLNKKLGVSDYAKMLKVHPNHLNKICRQIAGKTASEMISERLILEAKSALAYTKKSVSEIAYELGFNEPSYFFKFFKKHTGQSAIAYREKPKV